MPPKNEKNPLSKEKAQDNGPLEEGVDYYWEGGFMVLTAHYLKRRGYCCGNGCRHCPYGNASLSTLDGKPIRR